jgi:hypothetical protein
LNIATNGTLSGVPANSDANTNSFLVSVTDSGGLSNSTTMTIYVNGSPSFVVHPFALPGINAGSNYSGTIATNATDPNSSDMLTFAKVSGPAWLNIATNGTLSGVPANSDANTNSFLVSVTDPGGLSNTTTLYIYVNGAPYFLTDPSWLPGANAGQNYSGTIATNAADPNPSDSLIFAKVSGPAWLSVATNGVLSGAPLSTDAGTNSFVVQVSDPGNLSSTATINIVVQSSAPVLSLVPNGPGQLLLTWTGGNAPYQVLQATNLGNGYWDNYGGPTTSNSVPITPTNGAAFFRVLGQ